MSGKKEDLGVIVGTKEQAVWEKVSQEAKCLIEQSENNLIVQRAMLELAEKKIEEEKLKISE